MFVLKISKMLTGKNARGLITDNIAKSELFLSIKFNVQLIINNWQHYNLRIIMFHFRAFSIKM